MMLATEQPQARSSPQPDAFSLAMSTGLP